MKNIWNLTKKDLKIILKDRAAITWLFILPVVFILIFSGLTSLAAGGSSSKKETDTRTMLLVVNQDPQWDLTARFLNDIDQASGYRVVETDLATAEQSLKILKISLYLVIPANFSADLSQGKPVSVKVITHPDANVQGTQSLLQVVNGIAKDTSLELQLLDGIRQMGEMQAGNPEASQAFEPEKTLAQAKSQFERSRTTPLVAIVSRSLEKEGEKGLATFDLSASAVPGMTDTDGSLSS